MVTWRLSESRHGSAGSSLMCHFHSLQGRPTSSKLVLPARSPMPLMVTSAWRAPPLMPASVLAVARPRSLWQCVDQMALLLPERREEWTRERPHQAAPSGVDCMAAHLWCSR